MAESKKYTISRRDFMVDVAEGAGGKKVKGKREGRNGEV